MSFMIHFWSFNSFKGTIKKILLFFCYITRNKKERIVFFSSFGGKQYSDSPRAISETLHTLKPELRIVWSGDECIKTLLPKYVNFVRRDTFKARILMARASVWVLNYAYPKSFNFFKGSKTLYIQTWHGDRAFKKIGWAAFKDLGDNYSNKAYLPYLNDCDFLTVGSEYGEKQAIEGLNYRGNFIKYGLPRNDRLFYPAKHQEYIESIKAQLNIPRNVKILLYAPTFRDNKKESFESLIDIQSCLDNLNGKESNWIAIVRAHFGSKIGLELNDTIIDVSSYKDMADLLLIADCLISDYSSCAGDYILTKRPCVLAIFDQDEYEKSSRSLWVTPEKAGFVVARNQDELNYILSNLSEFDFLSISNQIMKNYGSYDKDNSSIQVCNKIIDWLKY